MVEDAVTDPVRIGQLLASELVGLKVGPLDAVDVAGADRSATPSPGGTVAYTVTHGGEAIGRVLLYPASVTLELDRTPRSHVDAEGVAVETGDGSLRLSLSSGVAVKRAVDAVRQVLGPGSS